MTCVLDSSCSFCAKEDENGEHLFWNCHIVKTIWSAFFDWWNISRSVTQGSGNFFQIIRLVKGTELKIAWSTSVIALFWTIWLARNELVYRNTKWEVDQVIWLVKIRAFKWLQAANKLNMGLENLWQVNPRGACLLFNKKHRRMDYIWCISTVKGFSDGSWKITNDGSKGSGIGGCITDLEGNLVYIFYGPCLANSPLEAEREALLFLFQRIKENSNLQDIFTLCTDSKVLEDIFIKERVGFREEDKLDFNKDMQDLINDKRFRIQFIYREFLTGADHLAKDGGLRNKMLQAWC